MVEPINARANNYQRERSAAARFPNTVQISAWHFTKGGVIEYLGYGVFSSETDSGSERGGMVRKVMLELPPCEFPVVSIGDIFEVDGNVYVARAASLDGNNKHEVSVSLSDDYFVVDGNLHSGAETVVVVDYNFSKLDSLVYRGPTGDFLRASAVNDDWIAVRFRMSEVQFARTAAPADLGAIDAAMLLQDNKHDRFVWRSFPDAA